MGRKRQKKQRAGGAVTLARAERELAKGNIREALKDAKKCYRVQPSPECRSLLERAYASRVEQLHKMKMAAEARAVLADLLDLKPTTHEVQRQLPRLQMLLGDSSVNPAEMLKHDPSLLVEVADAALLDPQAVPPDVEGLPGQVQQVRQALAAVERGEDEAAGQLLREIPRNSPLADWKLLVRGLSAFYQSDRARAAENWRRLDPKRPAWRIAATLQAAAGEPLEDDVRRSVAQPLKQLQAWSQNESMIPALTRLSEHWQSGDWRQFLQELQRLRLRCRNSQPELLDSLVDMTWKRAVREEDERLLEDLAQCVPAPAIDPGWHRAQALMEESLKEDLPYTAECWGAFANSLESGKLRPDERPIARGLIHLRLARLHISLADNYFRFEPEHLGSEAKEMLEEALGHLHKAIRCHPPLLDAYRELSSLHDRREQPDKSAAAMRRLLEQSPDDFQAHAKLARLYLELEQPEKSEPHIETIARLRPRGDETRTLRWNHALAMVRAFTKARQFEAARQELNKVASEVAPPVDAYVILTLRAAIEIKAQCTEPAERYLNEALATLEEPTVVWMQMAVLAARMSLPVKVRQDYNERFKKALKARPRSETAGCLARALASFRRTEFNYVGRATHERLVTAYLKRANRIRWQEGDLRKVCDLLELDGVDDAALRRKLLAKGEKQFRHSPYFRIHSASEALMALGDKRRSAAPHRIGRELDRLGDKVEQALELARGASPREEPLIEMGERLLGMIEDLRQIALIPPPFFLPPLAEMEEEDDEQDASDFLPGPAGMGMMFQAMMESISPKLRAELEREAARLGMTSEEAFMKFASGSADAFPGAPMPEFFEEPTGGPKRRRRR
jgi:tetratricopeptide (TPR) repeat protein